MRIPLAVLCLLAGPATAREPVLTPPLVCDPGAGCYIQQYTDLDPSDGRLDFACNGLVNDGHKGTDFALPSLAMMRAGVDVTASAPGTVRGMRDDMPDIPLDSPDAPDLAGRDCGNGMVIDHGDGWETQYCHLKRGSVAVRSGQRVGIDTVLGQVGLSGATTFPHVHLSVRHDGRVVDPFAPDAAPATCDPTPDRTLWLDPPAYRPGGLIAAGFADALPDFAAIEDGTAGRMQVSPTAKALVLWGYVFGGRAGDVLRLSIDGPDGPILTQDVVLDRAQPQLYRAVGRRTPPGGWPVGTYAGTVELRRDGQAVETRPAAVTVR